VKSPFSLHLTCEASDPLTCVAAIREGGPDVCPPDYKESDDRTFWIYFFLRFVGTVMLSGGVSMLDPIALTLIQKYGGEFGRERLFSTIGMAIFSPLAGLLMDRSSRQLSEYVLPYGSVWALVSICSYYSQLFQQNAITNTYIYT
jgi:hypothetical protein